TQDQATITLSNQPALLLSRLIIDAKVLNRASLATILYPHSKNPRGNLAATLRLLQRQLGYESIEATRSTLAILSDSNLWCDVWEWARLEDEIQHSWHSAEPNRPKLIRLLEQIQQIYRGEFMAQAKVANNFTIDNWLTLERERYRQAYVASTHKLLQLYQVEQARQEGLRLVQAALEHEPFQESFHIAYMRLLAESGAVDKAARWGIKMQRRLWRELATKPSPAYLQTLNGLRHTGTHRARVQATAPSIRYAAPAATQPIFGRTEQARNITTRLLNNQTRLLTLAGLGGIGKTALALNVAEIIEPLLPQGVCWVSFANTTSTSDPAAARRQIARKIAQQLQMHIGANHDDLSVEVIAHLSKHHLLLVLDSFESMMAGATYLTEILKQTARVCILLTSRQTPNLRTNIVETVTGLPIPKTGEADNPCVRLFVQRAQRQLASFRLEESNLASIIEICRLVGGIPLAIELATVGVPLFDVAEIAASVDQQINFLTNPYHDASQRQQSVMAILEYSWSQLPQTEQQLLTRLTIFQEQFHRRAAEQVCDATAAQLANLIHNAFLRVHSPGWLSIHPLMRRFLEQTQATSAQHQLETDYFTHFLGTLNTDSSVWDELETRRIMQRDRWDRQHADFVYAWQLAVQHQAFELLRDAVFGFSVYGAIRDIPGIVIEQFDRLLGQLKGLSVLSAAQEQLIVRLSLYITRYGHAMQQNSAEMIQMLESATALADRVEIEDWATYAKFRTMLTLLNWGHTERGMVYGAQLYATLCQGKNHVATRRTALTIIRKRRGDGLTCDELIPDWREQLHFQTQHELTDAITVQWAQLAARELSNHASADVVLAYVAQIVTLYEQQPHLVTGLEHRDLLNLQGQLLMESAYWEEALVIYERLFALFERPNALHVDPNRLIYEINHASVLAQMKQYTDAVILLQKNIAREGSQFLFFRAIARNTLADIYRKMGRFDLVGEQLLASLTLTTSHFQSETVVVALFLLACVETAQFPHALYLQILAATVQHTGIFRAFREEAKPLYQQALAATSPKEKEALLSKPSLQQLAQQTLTLFQS
ncbi:MAG: NB-ARC domain-containing protein, partial [Candidatus Promineifilaceae bacterium]